MERERGGEGSQDVRPLHLQVAIRFAFSVLPSLSLSLSIQPNQQCSLPSLGISLFSFSAGRVFLGKSPDFCSGKLNGIFLFREKCNLLIKLEGRVVSSS